MKYLIFEDTECVLIIPRELITYFEYDKYREDLIIYYKDTEAAFDMSEQTFKEILNDLLNTEVNVHYKTDGVLDQEKEHVDRV